MSHKSLFQNWAISELGYFRIGLFQNRAILGFSDFRIFPYPNPNPNPNPDPNPNPNPDADTNTNPIWVSRRREVLYSGK